MEATSKWHILLGLLKWSPEIVPARLPELWTAITPDYRVQSRRGLNQSCSPRWDLSNAMLHSWIGHREEVNSWLLVVGFCPQLGLQMSKWPMRGHFQYLRFKNFPMTPRTLQFEVFYPLLSSSKHSGILEDSKSQLFQVLGFTLTLGQSRGATSRTFQKLNTS
jgi:hypothetical protein